jgi:hypothetical protein
MTEKKWKHATVGNVIHDPWQASFLWQIYHWLYLLVCTRSTSFPLQLVLLFVCTETFISVAKILVGRGSDRPPPPPPSRKMTNFRKFWAKRGLKTAFSSANGGGGLPEIWKFCRKFRGLCPPPPPPEVNFRHWPPFVCKNHRLKNFLCTCQVFLMMAAVRTNKFSL